jgi:hypothetical protein
VLKIVNRYGILDSVLHMEKGSKVTTRNLIYDGETGDVVLTQTNNEFDDPVYNFSYPAHWAYTGMAPAYQNIGTLLKGVNFRKGIMLYPNKQRVPVERYFESGDELLVLGKDQRTSTTDDYCKDDDYYQFGGTAGYKKIWAVDAFKGKQGQKGIYFIDREGVPYSCNTQQIRIIRSGKRNMAGIAIGSVTTLQSPVRYINNVPRFVFDTDSRVITASAARFKDLWQVDSTTYRKDTQVITTRKMILRTITVPATDNYSIDNFKPDGGPRALEVPVDFDVFEASSYDGGTGGFDEEIKSWMRFNMTDIPQGALVNSATLHLYGRQSAPQQNYRHSNECYLERLKGRWPGDEVPNSSDPDILSKYFYDNDHETIDQANRVKLLETPHGQDVQRNEAVNITAMAQNMLDNYHSSGGVVSPALRISLLDNGGDKKSGNRLTYNSPRDYNDCFTTKISCKPFIELTYYEPCNNGSHPYYNVSDGEYYCLDNLLDTFLCKANINDTAVNFYRLGILGNWRMDRAYTYFSKRKQADPNTTTNIRTDGEIKDFAPYWAFTNTLLGASTDTARWVWNSELTRFNNKGFEIENHDPLNRYNAGQYGYNQTLPVAVAQNAKNREIAFDGFEDYGYQTDNCKNCLFNRHINLGGGANLVDTMSHTGLYSLRLNGNESVTKTFTIGLPGEVALKPELSMKEDSIPLVSTAVIGNGAGLTSYYYSTDAGPGCYVYQDGIPPKATGITSNVDYNTAVSGVFPGVCRKDWIYYSFGGYIQPRYTGEYNFWVTADDVVKIFITKNGVTRQITAGRPMEYSPHTQGYGYDDAISTESITLQAGELYYIKVLWDNYGWDGQVKLEWGSPGLQGRQIVPKEQLYPDGTNVATTKSNTVFNDTTWCVKFRNPTGINLTHKRFSPLQGQKVVVSAWVKQEGLCTSGNYENAQLNLTFNNTEGNNTFQFKPTGNIIEGWQRIEDTLTIPANATSLNLSMKATAGIPVYFDDVRIQPFNGNMKSFVYNPVNLRLMAELDENNYATFYEYDDEGTLIRLKKETERGVKTIKETRSALLKEKE